MKLLVTGANGFIGQELCLQATLRGLSVRGVLRADCNLPGITSTTVIGSIDGATDWGDALTGCNVVVHLAARVHVMHEKKINSLEEFRKVNVAGTLNLARQAAQAGIKRFVFVSSIKVNGESTVYGNPFTSDDTPAPQDAYGLSKLEAEDGLRQLAKITGMEVVVIRPPMVYGPGSKGNFASLLRWVRLGVPLPLGGVTDNRRSLVALDNLVDIILVCIDHPKAANQTFLVSDGEDLSTSELVRGIGNALNLPVRLLPFRTNHLALAACLIGKKTVAQRLLSSLEVDISKTRDILNWRPPISVEEGLSRAVKMRV